ncbi:hypothetical protein BS47DRAFT_1365391 [Hydnum rufescens UP504]|uniref:Uncharacterized protein n=1 Tax=Hydnum rufescens UP504 TaxID=1448309 RepID=A0A9P6ANV9_9AGAM|nr:hypothetical protein BS47DRAFT_1365391 [Hydnum rufescens UP504]
MIEPGTADSPGLLGALRTLTMPWGDGEAVETPEFSWSRTFHVAKGAYQFTEWLLRKTPGKHGVFFFGLDKQLLLSDEFDACLALCESFLFTRFEFKVTNFEESGQVSSVIFGHVDLLDAQYCLSGLCRPNRGASAPENDGAGSCTACKRRHFAATLRDKTETCINKPGDSRARDLMRTKEILLMHNKVFNKKSLSSGTMPSSAHDPGTIEGVVYMRGFLIHLPFNVEECLNLYTGQPNSQQICRTGAIYVIWTLWVISDAVDLGESTALYKNVEPVFERPAEGLRIVCTKAMEYLGLYKSRSAQTLSRPFTEPQLEAVLRSHQEAFLVLEVHVTARKQELLVQKYQELAKVPDKCDDPVALSDTGLVLEAGLPPWICQEDVLRIEQRSSETYRMPMLRARSTAFWRMETEKVAALPVPVGLDLSIRNIPKAVISNLHGVSSSFLTFLFLGLLRGTTAPAEDSSHRS